MQKKYQIFVSSTFRDLADERQDTIRSILDLGHIPAGMELFPATDSEQLTYIKKVIDECDYYVLILGGRYGSLDAEGVSFTEREYDYAVETGKVVLAFVHGDASLIPVGKSDTGSRLVQNLNEFREKVMAGRLVRQWTSREGLEAMVVKAISRATNGTPAVGWIRGNAVASEELLVQLNDLRDINDKLRAELFHIKQQNIPALDDLADLNSSINVPYTYIYSTGRGSSIEKPEIYIAKWADLFKAIGPELYSPSQRSAIELALRVHIKERAGNFPKLPASAVIMIENQFIAYGYIESYNANSVKGGVNAYYKITDVGRSKLTELLAVRSGEKQAS